MTKSMKNYPACKELKSDLNEYFFSSCKWAAACDFQQCGILTYLDSDKPVQPPFKHRTSKCYLVSSLTVIEYSHDLQRLWSDCRYTHSLVWAFAGGTYHIVGNLMSLLKLFTTQKQS